jgi:hypothetical protein
LKAEARLFARYLLGRTPPQELLDRYVEASHVLFDAPPDPADAALRRFVRRHPWSTGFLDAAAALLRPAGQFRGRLLVMVAILETSPLYAEEFLPRPSSAALLPLRLAAAGTRAVARALVGLLLYIPAVRAAP